MFPIPMRRNRRVATCSWGPEDPSRKAKSKSRFYNEKTRRWEWRYCY